MVTFRQLKLGVVAVLLCLLSSLAFAAEPIGKIIAVRGDVHMINIKGISKGAKRGEDFYQGDKLVTKDKASVKIRFIDGTLTSLKPNSILQIEKYQYDPKKSKDNANISVLVKGGLKSISGLINKKKKDAYTIKTRIASIGVRGTIFEVDYFPDQEIFGGVVYSGMIEITRDNQVTILRGGDLQNAFSITKNESTKRLTTKQYQQFINDCQ